MKYPIKEILSEGYVMGEALKLSKKIEDDEYVSVEFELVRLNHSISKTSDELNAMKSKNPDLAEYLETERLIAVDPILKKRVINEIENGLTARAALEKVMNSFIDDILKSTSEYLRERANDVNDILSRLITNLERSAEISDDDKYVLITDVLYPSLLIQRRNNIIGIIVKKGGYTSHAAILCRSFDIPYVIAPEFDCDIEDTLIIDTRIKQIDRNPSPEEKAKFSDEYAERSQHLKSAIYHKSNYYFLANVSNSFEVLKAAEYNYDGVGLYRTEMIFMNSERPYTFLEQYSVYSEAVKLMKNKPITFRTFDVGDDKKLPYLKTNKKGIDNYIDNPEIFEAQVSAIMKANINNNIKIMFPMIYSNSEFEYLRDWLIKIARKNNYSIPQIGMMLETKDALEHIQDFIKTDFISVGTNDLVRDLYGIDRESETDLSPYIDDLIEKLKPAIEFANAHDKMISVCGELASVKEVAKKLYKAGIRALSVSPSLIRMLNVSYDEFMNLK